MKKKIEVVGAHLRNLKSVDVEFATGRMTLVAGVSGSGKSSLVESVAAEAYRRMRRFLSLQLDWPDDEGPSAYVGPLGACIHTAQRAFRATQRTTIATSSGLLTLLRRLFLQHGSPYCEAGEVPAPSAETYSKWLERHQAGRITIWAVPAYFVQTDGVTIARKASSLGFEQATVRSESDSPNRFAAGRTIELTKWRPLSTASRHIIEIEVASMELTQKTQSGREKLRKELNRAFEVGKGHVLVEFHATPRCAAAELRGPFGYRLDSKLHWLHPTAPAVFAPPNSHLLSFNQPEHAQSGACPVCRGTGRALTLDMAALLPDAGLSMHEGAFSLWAASGYKHVNIRHETIEGLRGIAGFSPEIPWGKLPEPARELILNGSGETLVEDRHRSTGRGLGKAKTFPGFRSAILERIARGGASAQQLKRFATESRCDTCIGSRWSPQARALRVSGINLLRLGAIAFSDFPSLTGPEAPWCGLGREPHVQAIEFLARAFTNAGLGHLTPDRSMTSLSEGESRRLGLASLLALGSSGLVLMLDEPSRGLHEQDLSSLVASLRRLKEQNHVVVTDHRRLVAEAADAVVVLGPGAGSRGGEVIHASGANGQRWKIPKLEYQRARLPFLAKVPSIRLRGGAIHNVQHADCDIPLGSLTCITGVSGSGKSSFIRGVLVPALAHTVGDESPELASFILPHGRWKKATVEKPLGGILALDQRTPPPNRRSLVLTSLGLAEPLRKRFAQTAEAQCLGLAEKDFGLNAGSGRCPECEGLGSIEQSGRWSLCPVCGGRRFRETVLGVELAGINMAQALALPLEQAQRCADLLFPEQSRLIAMACRLGLGHIPLQQPLDQLSGGELQRLRIAAKLWPADARDWVVVLDEPTAGLHARDIDVLLEAFDDIVAGGKNTLILIEHNVEVIRQADWLVDFGPGGGPAGGKVLACGRPEEVMLLKTPTARALRDDFLRPEIPDAPAAVAREAAIPQAAREWLRVLLGVHSDPPEGQGLASVNFERLESLCSTALDHNPRVAELGSLDVEIAQLLLSAHQLLPVPEQISELVERWKSSPDAALWISPYIGAMMHWGLHLPLSAERAAGQRMKALQLSSGQLAGPGSPGLRATGNRFAPEGATCAARTQKVEHALALGEGLVELRASDTKLLARVVTRQMDLERGLVAPAGLSVEQLLRTHRAGSCPMCRGDGSVRSFREALVIAKPNLAPDVEGFYTPEALDILRWIRRSVQIPFYRRLAEEGLLDGKAPFSKWPIPAKQAFLWGYWQRPGHGSFLSTPKADPDEVSAWLRWDGLSRLVLENLDRSRTAAWAESFSGSLSLITCPLCHGSGLKSHADLVEIEGKSLREWLARESLSRFVSALKKLPVSTPRDRRTLLRVLSCLEPMTKDGSSLALKTPAAESPAVLRSYEKILEEFTWFRSGAVASPG